MSDWENRGVGRRPGHRSWCAATAVIIILAGLSAVTGALPHTPAGSASADEVTVSQDSLRTGWDPSEPGLSPAVVAGGHFGPVFATPVNGQVYAQPLVIGSTVIVATENDWVYGINSVTGQVKWSLSLGTPGPDLNCPAVGVTVGITSTPVYDPGTRAVYMVARIVPPGRSVNQSVYQMIGVNIITGGVVKRVTVAGTPSNDPGMPFNSYTALQRPGLLLLDGWVYAAFASFCDQLPYKGYVAGVQIVGQRLTLWTDEAGPGNTLGGIWQSGGGLMSDGPGRIFFASGNGTPPGVAPGSVFQNALGEAVVRLGVQADGSLREQDFFSPANAPYLNSIDFDLGSGSPVGLPFGTARYPHLLVQGGKDGRVFLLNRDHLGGRAQGPGGTDAVVSMAGPFSRPQAGHPAVFGNASTVSAAHPGSDYIYYLGCDEDLRALKLTANSAGVPILVDAGDSTATLNGCLGSPVVTSSGSNPSSAVVWAVSGNGPYGDGGKLEAFAAIPHAPCSQTVATACMRLLWAAPIGVASRFSMPATAAGRVYVGTRDGHLIAFGALGTAQVGEPVASGLQPGSIGPAIAHPLPTVTVPGGRAVASTSGHSQEAVPVHGGPEARDGQPGG